MKRLDMEGDLKNLQVGYGSAKGCDSFAVGTEAARQAVRGIDGSPLVVVLVFASVHYDLEEMLRGIHAVVGDTPVMGATTAGEICNQQQQESVVVVALASPYVQVRVGVGQKVSRDWQQAVAQAVSAPEVAPFFSSPGSNIWTELTLQGKSAFGLLFSPGNTKTADSRSFEILEELKRLSLGRVPFVGGAAADDWRLESNYVFWGRQAYPDSVLVAVFETQLRFGLALAHGFHPTSRKTTVTRVKDHEVLELDNRPAAEIYSQLQGLSREILTDKHLTLATGRPMATAVGFGEYSINVASFFTANGGVRFAQPVPEGTVLTVMEGEIDDLVAAGAEAFHKALTRGSIIDPALALVFPCALRTPLLGERQHEVISGIRNLVPGVPVAGFYSFGEQGLYDDGQNRHNNEVITILVLGRQLSYAAQVALENERLSRELLTTRDRLQRLLSSSPAMIYSCHPSGDFGTTYISENVTMQLGYEPRDFLEDPRFLNSHIHPQDDPRVFAELPALFEKGFHALEYRFRHQDGSWRWMHEDLTLVRDAHGRPQEIIGYWVDVTERRQAEEALQESESRYRSLVENIDLGITAIGSDYKVIMANAAQGRILKKTPQELVGKVCFQEFEKRDRMCPHCPGAKAMASGQPAIAFTEGVRDDGSLIPARIHAFPTYGPGGEVNGFVELVEDIRELKRAEEAIRKSEEKYRGIFDESVAAIFEFDNDKNFINTNQAGLDLLGYSPEELLSMNMQDVDADPLIFLPAHEKILAGGRLINHEHKLRRKDHTIITVLNNSRPLTDRLGNVVGMLSTMIDITARKQAEEALMAAELRRRIFFEQSLDGIVVLDEKGKVFEANPSYARMLGYPLGEVQELHLWDWDARWSRSELEKKIREMDEGGDHFETQHRRKDGSIFDVEITSTAAVLGGQKLTFCHCRDITERKKAEDQIRASLQEKVVLLKEIHHRVKNNMQIISTILSLQGKYSQGRDPEELFQDCKDRIRSMALIHESLYGTGNLSKIDFLEYLKKLTKSVAYSHGAMEMGIKVTVTGDHLILDISRAVPCGLIANELLVNSLKHAFPEKEGGEIQVHLEVQGENQKVFEVKDNGVGLAPDFSLESSATFGWLIINNLVKQIGGSMTVESNGGAAFRIVF
jgi:PAS domain S-box-containing protein